MKSIRCWIEAMRLRTLPVSVAGVLTAAGFNIATGTVRLLPIFLCLFFAILCQIASNFANEYYDYRAGRDHVGRSGPRRGVTEGDISARSMKMATYGVLLLAAAVGLSLTYWGSLWLILAGALIGLGALAYSTGPWPLSTHCMGEVAVIVFFGIVPVNLTFYICSGLWAWSVFAASVSIGLMGANVLIVNNYRDIDDDKSVGKHTLATALGRRAMVVLYFINSLLAALLMLKTWISLGFGWILAPILYVTISAAITYALSKKYGSSLNPFLGMTAMVMLLYSITFVSATLA